MNQSKNKLIVKKVTIPHTQCERLSEFFREMSHKGLQLHSIELKRTLFGEKLFCRFVKNEFTKLNYCSLIYAGNIPTDLNKFVLFKANLGWNLLCADYDSKLFVFCSENHKLPHIEELNKEKFNLDNADGNIFKDRDYA